MLPQVVPILAQGISCLAETI